MNTHADKSTESKSQAIANSLPKQPGIDKPAFQFEDNRPEAIAQRKMREAINNSPQVKQLKAYQAIADNYTSQTAQNSYPIQRTIFNMGDDPELAKKDGASLGKKLGHDVIEVPIPALQSPDAIVAKASSPFVVMFHGKTLRTLGAIGFKELLIAKGYPRSKGLELVLITCSADPILGEDAQMLSNELQSKIRAAKGKVVVQANGIPWVTVKGQGDSTITYKDDIFEIMGGYFEDFADGWHLYTPQPEETLKVIKLDAQRQKRKAGDLSEQMASLAEAIGKAPEPSKIVALGKRVNILVQETNERYERAEAMTGKATNDEMLRYRAMIENAAMEISGMRTEVDQLKQDWKEHNGTDLSIYLFYLKNPVEETETVDTGLEEGNGWGSDVDLDALLEENPGDNSPTETVLKKSVDANPTAVVQQVMITPGEPLSDGRMIDDIMNGFNDLDLAIGNNMTLRVQFGETDEEQWAKTNLLLDDVVSIAFEALTMENANKRFEIRITLSEEQFKGGQQQMSQLIATLTHEWELHGRQHALNIQKIKNAQVPDTYFGHGHFFEPGQQGIDRAMAQGIAGARPEDKAGILTDYLKDANDHITFVMEGWREGKNQQAVSFQNALYAMKGSWNVIKNIKPVGNNQATYEALITAFLGVLDDAYFNKAENDATAEGIQYFIDNPREFYNQLIAAYSTTVPGNEEEIYKISRDQFKSDHIRNVLLYANNFTDATKAIENNNATPRKAAMEGLGHR